MPENTCGSCIHFNGEECTNGNFDGCERYSHSPACGDFEEVEDRFEEVIKTAEFSDAYWLRSYAGQAIQGILAGGLQNEYPPVPAAIQLAQALLAEVKKCEVNND